MSSLGSRLKVLRERKSLTQLKASKMLGVTNVQLSRYESDINRPEPELLGKMAALYDVSVDYLVTGHIINLSTSKKKWKVDPLVALRVDENDMVAVPVLGSIRAGQPIEMIRESAPEYQLTERSLVHNHDAFLLRVKGDSMNGDLIFDGDQVLVIYTCDFSPSDICVVAIDGEEATLKRVKQQDDMCILIPSNKDMEPMIYSAKDVHIIGVVVEVRRRIRK